MVAIADKESVEATKEELLREIIRELIGLTVVGPLNEQIHAAFDDMKREWNEIHKVVDPVLDGKVAQCPECGGAAFAAAMCEGLQFICPSCEANLEWKFHELTNRYTLVKP